MHVVRSSVVYAALSVALLVPAASVRAQRPYGADYSHWNGTITPSQWATLYASGWVFAFTKATESVDYTDVTFVNNMVNARNAGIYIGGYHFARPEYGNTAVAEANYFVSVAGPYISAGYLRPVLDLETGYSLGATALSNWVNAWMDRVQTLTGVEPIIYTNTNYATYYLNSTVANRILWIANWPTNPDPQNGNPGIGVFNAWTFWQYTATGTLPGLSGSHDLDVFNGTYAQLQNHLIPGGTQPPSITQHPASTSTVPGSSASFTVGATGGTPLSYQWQKNQANLSNGGHYSGVNTATLVITNADSSDAANYRCVVTNAYGTATSNEATLTISNGQVIISDTFDSYANQAAFQAVWPTATSSLVLGTAVAHSTPNALYSAASTTTSYQNQRNFAETVASDAYPLELTFWFYDGGGSGAAGNQWVELRDYAPAATQLIQVGVYGGSSTTYYSARVAYPPGNGWALMSENGAPQRSVGWHQFRVVIKSTTIDFYLDNVLASGNRAYASTQGSISWEQIRVGTAYTSTATAAYYDDVVLQSVSTGPQPPAITQHPQPQSICAGGTATFTVAASGEGTLSYQWQKNGGNLSNGGHYSGVNTATLVITNADSSDAANYRCVVTNAYGTATSNEATLTISNGQVIISDTFDSYANQAAFQAVWPTATSSLVLGTAVAHSTPNALYSAASTTTSYQNQRNFAETVASDAYPLELTFWFYDGGGSGAAGNQWVELRDYAPAATQLIQVGVYGGSSTTYYSARVAYPPGNGWALMSENGAPQRSVGWHQFRVVIKSTTIDFYLDNVLASGNRAYASTQGSISWEQIRVGTAYTSTATAAYYDDVVLQSVSTGPQPPAITQHPQPQSICAGGTATFTVAASGEGTLSYQWQKNGGNLSNGGHYSGVTTATLTVTNADGNDAADYRCVVSVGCTTATSNAVALTIRAATVVTSPPVPQSVNAGDTAQFQITATGEAPLTYQWQKNSVDLSEGGHYSGVLTDTLTIADADAGDEGDYRCVVTGGCGSVTSNEAALTVLGIWADFDNDLDVDLSDFGTFQNCFNGPNRAPKGAGCEPADSDGDGDVDLIDFGAFQNCFNGPNRAPKC